MGAGGFGGAAQVRVWAWLAVGGFWRVRGGGLGGSRAAVIAAGCAVGACWLSVRVGRCQAAGSARILARALM